MNNESRKFLDSLDSVMNDDNIAYTENDALAFRTTKSAVLDFFATGGAIRSRTPEKQIDLFSKAYKENPLLAVRALFYFRDIRGGQGERNTFRTLLRYLVETAPNTVRANIKLIPEYGRWDDIYVLFDSELEHYAMKLIHDQFTLDLTSDRPSLLAKWLKSENTSSPESRRLAQKIRKNFGISSRLYRKSLSMIRRRIGLVEQHISANEWNIIDYDKIPSKAGMLYRKAFRRHDNNRYSEFLEDVKSGKKTINATTLYPYEITEKCGTDYSCAVNMDNASLDALWNALPNYFEGNESVRGLVVADVSGSMIGRPMAVSTSLAIYTAERNTGPFSGKYISFTDRPRLITVKGDNIVDKVHQVMDTDVGYNTNVKAVFDMILHTAKKGGLSQEDLPTHLYVVSDMEFDSANAGSRSVPNERLFETIAREYKEAGYNMPFLVFWNVNSRNDQHPMSMDKRGFQLVSGCSPSIFKSLLANKATSAYDLMLEVLNGERYSEISIAESTIT
jgi:hypothetical protein